MKTVFFGSSLLSSYWNGAATYYRGVLKELASRGHEIVFCEPDAFGRQERRDMDPPAWARSVVFPATADGVRSALDEARDADAVIKASGVGVFDDALLLGALRAAPPNAARVFWDVDAPATLGELACDIDHPLRRALPTLDLVLTYGGGAPVERAYTNFGARKCVPVYNGLDPATHFPARPDPRFQCDLGFLANRLPDREARVETFFMSAARASPRFDFLIGGAGWETKDFPPNVRAIGHVGTADHNAFNATPRALLNVARDSMAAIGFSPATRVFEAAGAGACLITDAWEGVELFFEPGRELLVARDGQDVVDLLKGLSPARAKAIGAAALARARAEHTYANRGALADALLREAVKRRRERTEAA